MLPPKVMLVVEVGVALMSIVENGTELVHSCPKTLPEGAKKRKSKNKLANKIRLDGCLLKPEPESRQVLHEKPL